MADRLHDRLREARVRAGFKSAAAAARANGWTAGAYRHHENGTRAFDLKAAIKYGVAFGANPRYLLGLDPAFDRAGVHEFFNNAIDPTPDVSLRSALIKSVRSSFGIELLSEVAHDGTYDETLELNFRTTKYHGFNREFLDSIDPALTQGNAAVMIMQGGSMGGTAPDGSMLLIDTRRRLDRIDEIYVLYNEESILVRRVRGFSDDHLHLVADNKDVPEQRVERGGFGLIGRVRWIGKLAG